MKRTLFLWGILGTALVAQAQTDTEPEYYRAPTPTDTETQLELASDLDMASPPRVQTGLSVGTSVAAGAWGSGTHTWVAPHLSFQPHPRWTLRTGLAYGRQTGLPFAREGSVQMPTGHTMSGFASGTYQASDRLFIMGTAWYERFGGDGPAATRTFDRSALMMNAEYRVSERFSIGVGVQATQGASPYWAPGFGGMPGFGGGMMPGRGW